MERFKQWYQNHTPFFWFMLLAAVLRFYKIGDMPFDSDELSAVFRAQKSANFIENIKIGVLADGHPFFVQFAIWFFISTLHAPLLLLKLLWAGLSLISIALSYFIVLRVFNKSAANFTIAFLSILWWNVDLATWVRPYIIGQFAVLMAIDAITKLRLEWSKTAFVQAIFGIWLGLSSHYFAGLTIIMYSLLFCVFYRDSLKWMAQILGLALLLYIPQWFILRAHLHLQGLNWLSAPTLQFIWNHVYFIFNKQPVLLGLVGISLGFGGWLMYTKKTKLAKHAWIFAGTWIGVFLVGFIYSVLRKPVLQDNVLFFALPLFLGFGGYVFSHITQKIQASFFALIAFLGIFNLIFNKHHYDLAMRDKYQYPMMEVAKKSSLKESGRWTFLVDGPIETLNFYRAQFNIPQKTNLLYASNYANNLLPFTDSIIRDLDQNDTLFYALNSGSDLTQLTAFMLGLDHIPNQGRNPDHYVGGSIYCFTSKSTKPSNTFVPSKTVKAVMDSNYLFRWSDITNFKSDMKEHQKIEQNDFLVVTFVPKDTSSVFHLVSSILNQGFNKALSQIDYRHTESQKFKGLFDQTVIHCIKLSDIPYWNNESFLRISMETKQQNSFQIKPSKYSGDLKIYHIKGNPILYGF